MIEHAGMLVRSLQNKSSQRALYSKPQEGTTTDHIPVMVIVDDATDPDRRLAADSSAHQFRKGYAHGVTISKGRGGKRGKNNLPEAN